jgi:protein CpxP
MRNVFKGMTVGVAALGLVVAFGLTALAQQGPGPGRQGGPWGRGPRAHAMALGFALGQLDLTAAQREQVQAILQQHRAERQVLAQQARAARLALNQAVEAPTVDEGAIKAASASLGEVHTQMALMRARVRSEVLQVLTPEQRAKAEALKAERAERMKQRRAPRPAPPQ